jgi:transcriptional regulator with XRE-family HTH domain
MTTLGKKLRDYRLEAKMSQQEVADALEIAQSTYHMWESDRAKLKLEYLPKIAELYGIEPTELIPEGTTVKIVNNRENKDNSINGFEIKVDARDMYREIINSKNEVIAAKDAVITSLSDKITTLQAELKKQKGSD